LGRKALIDAELDDVLRQEVLVARSLVARGVEPDPIFEQGRPDEDQLAHRRQRQLGRLDVLGRVDGYWLIDRTAAVGQSK
jgi:hypothetical protein